MTEQPTCGQGLAEHAVLPREIAELVASLADTLEAHTLALELSDDNAQTEHEAYTSLVGQHRDIAARLVACGEEMAGYRDLPMGRHDPEAMTSPQAVAAFDHFVKAERSLAELLGQRQACDETMLAEMTRAAGDRLR